IPAQNSLTYALTNTLHSRVREKAGRATYREIMRLKLAQTYDIREARRDTAETEKGSRPFGDVTIELDLSPLQYFALSARNIYGIDSGGWQQANYDLTVSDNRGDSLSAGYRYTRDVLEEINLWLKASLTSSLDALYVLRHNKLDGKTIEATYGVRYHRQCWNFEFAVSDRQDDRTYMVYLSLLGMGTGGGR
ncbi:MAG: LPS assembly protein LptD, partial [Proteobacteria bacterium]|nr:LPS assembly protein LptD [Pseudomonadota bacterium]